MWAEVSEKLSGQEMYICKSPVHQWWFNLWAYMRSLRLSGLALGMCWVQRVRAKQKRVSLQMRTEKGKIRRPLCQLGRKRNEDVGCCWQVEGGEDRETLVQTRIKPLVAKCCMPLVILGTVSVLWLAAARRMLDESRFWVRLAWISQNWEQMHT